MTSVSTRQMTAARSMSNIEDNPFLLALKKAETEGALPSKVASALLGFYTSYCESLKDTSIDITICIQVFLNLFEYVKSHLKTPFAFEPYHEMIREPIDYYAFGLEFLRPLVDLSKSKILGMSNLQEIAAKLSKGHNVILFANHQIEADPQAISLLLESSFPKIGEEMIFVAGERVITDPLAVPFSMGRNLLCIYSKRYIDNPPELKQQKQLHNQKTMQKMSELLSQGGQCIYVAPSGGRDRPDENGVVQVAAFDPQSIEMFYLMARRAKTLTHFYPLALTTYDILPPPETVQIELGEQRSTKREGIALAFGKEIEMEKIAQSVENKKMRRIKRADFIWQRVKEDYNTLRSTQ